MASILEMVQQHVGPAELAQISQHLGIDPATAQQAVNAALPAMVGGVASHAQAPEGAGMLQQMIGSHAGVLGSLGSLLGAGAVADGGGLLGQILGQHQPAVQQGVQQASGLGSDQTKKLLMILAPIVLGAVAKRAMEHGTAHQDPAQLQQILHQDGAQAVQAAQTPSHQTGGLLGKLMDLAESPEMRNRS